MPIRNCNATVGRSARPPAAGGRPRGAAQHGLQFDADWITFEATISTSLDQVAVAPGNLVKDWTDKDRRYFHYRMIGPIVNMYTFLSGAYEVARDSWNDVAIAVYHHKDHAYNVDRMIESIQKSLAYYTANFTPYQHRQVRIIEFPGYATFAQSLPTTIPYSETAHHAPLRGVDPIQEDDCRAAGF